MKNHTNVYSVSMVKRSRKLYTKLTGLRDYNRIILTPYDYELKEEITPVEYEIQDPNVPYRFHRFAFIVESLIAVIPE